jgi:hypothetical protein
MGPIGCHETSVRTCHYSLCNNHEERSSNLRCDGRLKSRMLGRNPLYPWLLKWHVVRCFRGSAAQRGPWPPRFTRFLYHTQRRATVGRAPPDEWSARRRDLYLTTHNTHNRQTSMPPSEIRTHDLSRRAAVDLRLGPRSQLKWHNTSIIAETASSKNLGR